MISPASGGDPEAAAHSPIAWLSSEIMAKGWGGSSRLEEVRILIVLQSQIALGRTESKFMRRVSEALASQDRFPNLKSAEIFLCFWDRIHDTRPRVGSKTVLKAYKKDTEALSRRGSLLFDLRWKLYDVRRWGLDQFS
jgi:hypothetical protein